MQIDYINRVEINIKKIELQIDDLLYTFYSKLGQTVGKLPEEVMQDALFRLAGEASLQSIHKAKKHGR